MSQMLRQSTSVIVRIGPFVDVTDGFTPETGITLGAADEAEALRAAGAATLDISAATWAAVAGADGWYDLTLDTTATNTIGVLTIVVQDDSVCLPVFTHFQVIEEASYDTIYAASALPASTTNITGGTITTVTTVTNQLTAAAIATGVWQDATAGDFTTASSIGKALYIANVAPGAAGGHFIAGANAATSITTALTANIIGNITGNLSGSVGTLSGNVVLADASSDAVIADAVWNAATVTYGAAGSYGLLVETDLDAAISSRMATYTQPTGFLAATFPTGTVANTTNITAGTITTVTNLTNLPATAALEATLTSMKGATFAEATDSLEALRNRGDAAWITATGFSTLVATDIVSAGAITTSGGKVSGVILTDTVTTYTGNTPQTGDTYALANGATGFAAIDTVVDAVKAQTDKFVFTVANQVNANVQSINDVALTGDGSGTPFNV